MTASPAPIRILFVCLGNICRSPLAEGIFRRDVRAAGLDIEIDSAGTGNWHVGRQADPRAIAVGKARGCEMTMIARQVKSYDFDEFDLIVAMDRDNHYDLLRWPGAIPEKVRLARSFDPSADSLDVPDPYYDAEEGFERIADMLEAMSAGILRELRAEPRSVGFQEI